MARSGHNGGVASGPLKPAELAVRVRRLPLQPSADETKGERHLRDVQSGDPHRDHHDRAEAEKEICDVSAPQSVSTCFSTPS